jgi:hypothetical protein
MSDTFKIKLKISSTAPEIPLGLEVWVDDKCITNTNHVNSLVLSECEISDDEGKHDLRIVLKNKQPEHTKLDTDGNIVQDAMLTVELVEFSEININDLFIANSQYTHSFNSDSESVTCRCYGALGCNGTVSLQFATPFYLWLLETM